MWTTNFLQAPDETSKQVAYHGSSFLRFTSETTGCVPTPFIGVRSELRVGGGFAPQRRAGRRVTRSPGLDLNRRERFAKLLEQAATLGFALEGGVDADMQHQTG